MPRPCAACGETFTPFREGQLCCSYKCNHDRRRPTPKPCEACAQVFQPERSSARFCSRACGHSGRRKLLDRPCAKCSTFFHPKSARHRFCSRACHAVTVVKGVKARGPVLYIGGDRNKAKVRALLMREQGGKCAACACVLEPGYRTNIDHCHGAGHVRSLLCQRCNTALGLCREDPAWLRALADYAERCRTLFDEVSRAAVLACLADGWTLGDAAQAAGVTLGLVVGLRGTGLTEAALNADSPDTNAIEKPA